MFDTFIIGIIGSVCAQIFIVLLHFISKFSLEYLVGYIPQDTIKLLSHYTAHYHAFNNLMLLVVIVTGGLISGILVYTFAPEAEGHGTDTVIRAFHRNGGYLRPVVVPIKIITSAITIGTGGSAGREGPTALFSAGVGSFYAKFRKVGWKRRQIFVLIGMASGLSAVFKAPLGTSIFAIEVLYADNEFETREFIYVLFGPLVAYTITGFLFGWQPIFHVPNVEITHLNTYFEVVFLGLFSGAVAIILPNIFYGVRDFFRELPIRPHYKPALGALMVGVIAIYFPEVLGGGYGFIQESINGNLIGTFVLMLLIAKIFAFSFTVGSGGSGGVFAPSLFIGAMLGAFVASVFNAPIAAFVVIAMAAVFGAAARTPLATIVMVAEMTGGYNLLAPTTLGVLSAYIMHNILVRVIKPKYISLYEAQLLNKEYSISYQMDKVRDILICHSKILNLKKAVVQRDDIISLLEKGEAVEVGDNKYVFLGTFTKEVKLSDGELFKRYKGADIIYVFRHGKWLHNSVITTIKKDDEVLMVGKKETIDIIKNEFISLSQTFSKLRIQEENIE